MRRARETDRDRVGRAGRAAVWVAAKRGLVAVSACAAVASGVLAGCDGERAQSMLHPAGPSAARIAELWWVMFAVYGGVFVLTMLVLVLALIARRREEPALGNRFIAIGGIGIPLVILIAMLAYTIAVTAALSPRHTDLTIEVEGHQWWWEMSYPEHGIVTANELYIPVGASVRLDLRSADVVHSFWVPELGGKTDLLPERPNTMWIEAKGAGTYRGQCAEYCGTQHARMAFFVVAVEPEQFERWVAARRQPRPPPETERLARGREAFLDAGCGACHGIEGVSVATAVGPDLTHMGSRLSIGAASLPNTADNLAAWIINPHLFKPGNLMPPTHIDADDLEALVAYLRSLK